MVRIYTLEGHDQLNQALDILRDEEKIIGVTIIRGIEGFGCGHPVSRAGPAEALVTGKNDNGCS